MQGKGDCAKPCTVCHHYFDIDSCIFAILQPDLMVGFFIISRMTEVI